MPRRELVRPFSPDKTAIGQTLRFTYGLSPSPVTITSTGKSSRGIYFWDAGSLQLVGKLYLGTYNMAYAPPPESEVFEISPQISPVTQASFLTLIVSVCRCCVF